MKLSLAVTSIFVFAVLHVGIASAVTVEAQGSATVTNGAVNKARLQAIGDAMRQATMMVSADVVTTSVVSANVLLQDKARVHAAARVSNVEILDEWQDDNQITVLIRAEVPDMPDPEMKSGTYRRKVAVMQFDVPDRRSIHDLPGVEQAYPRAFLRMLEQHGGVIGVDATAYVLHEQLTSAAGPDRGMIRALAEALDVQFIVTGVFNNLSKVEKWLSDGRQLNVTLQVYDGISGSLVSHHQYAEHVKDTGMVDQLTFGSEAFNNTALGMAIQELIGRQVGDVALGIGRLPVTVRVIRAEGRKVYFNAGASSLIRVGDLMMAYKVEQDPVSQSKAGGALGYVEAPVATVTVKTLQPLFAMGEMETDEIRLAPGDLLRFGW